MSDCNCHLNLDLDLAVHVQQLLFPKSSPTCSWSCIGVRNRMASRVGGDYFDFITMPDGCQAIFLGDVTGRGLHASLVMALIYGFIHRTALEHCRPVEMMLQLNSFLQTFARRSERYDEFFSSTLFWGVIDPGTLQMQYVNAGHPPPMIRRGSTIQRLSPTAPPLGFFDHPEMTAGEFHFIPGDRMLLYTDGLTEAFSPDGHPFGMNRLQSAFAASDDNYLTALGDLYTTLATFTGQDKVDDDCTTIMLDFNP